MRRIISLLLGACFVLSGVAQSQTAKPDPLLAVDQHRATVVERIVTDWGDKLTATGAGVNRVQLREMLFAMRADQLLAASLAGSVNGLRDVVAQAPVGAKGVAMAKVLGDPGADVVYVPVTPCRLVETRGTFPAVYQGDGSTSHLPVPFGAGEIRTYTVEGGNGVCLSLSGGVTPAAVQLQVFGIPVQELPGDIEVLPQGAAFGSTATLVFLGTNPFTSAGTTTRINQANRQISVQVRTGFAHVAIDVVGYFQRPTNYGGTHVIHEQYATDSGGYNITAGGEFSTVSGGLNNTASGVRSTVGGGGGNTASGGDSTISGGFLNNASGGASNIAGGQMNIASGVAYSTVGGGYTNAASGGASTVAGGQANTASGSFSTVAGGLGNIASGFASFAAGHHAKTQDRPGTTVHAGAFVWADYSGNHDFNSAATNEFAVRATGGVRLVLGIDDITGAPAWTCSVASGGSWACSSDRSQKQNLRQLDGQGVLAQLATMPIYSWNPKGENAHLRHFGPTAQDFYAAFGLGESELRIGQQDADGVALAAIQGLNAKLEAKLTEKDREITELRRAVEALVARISRIARMAQTH